MVTKTFYLSNTVMINAFIVTNVGNIHKQVNTSCLCKLYDNLKWQVALTENWGETYKNKGIGFYSMHPGWADTPGVAKSLPSFSKS